MADGLRDLPAYEDLMGYFTDKTEPKLTDILFRPAYEAPATEDEFDNAGAEHELSEHMDKVCELTESIGDIKHKIKELNRKKTKLEEERRNWINWTAQLLNDE